MFCKNRELHAAERTSKLPNEKKIIKKEKWELHTNKINLEILMNWY